MKRKKKKEKKVTRAVHTAVKVDIYCFHLGRARRRVRPLPVACIGILPRWERLDLACELVMLAKPLFGSRPHALLSGVLFSFFLFFLLVVFSVFPVHIPRLLLDYIPSSWN